MHKNLTELKHPLLLHKLGYLRDKNTISADFRNLMSEISKLLAYEAMKDWKDLEIVGGVCIQFIALKIENADYFRVGNDRSHHPKCVEPHLKRAYTGPWVLPEFQNLDCGDHKQ